MLPVCFAVGKAALVAAEPLPLTAEQPPIANIRSVNDLYREMLLNLKKAQLLISKMPDTPGGCVR